MGERGDDRDHFKRVKMKRLIEENNNVVVINVEDKHQEREDGYLRGDH